MTAASICTAASAAEPNPLEPAVYWRMEFGAPQQSPIRGYGFALRHGSDKGRAAPALVQFDVSRTGALARLAGIPLNARTYKLGQTDEAGEPGPETEQAENTPWYARQWVWWTGAGLALTAALADGEDPGAGNNQNGSGGGRGGVLCDGNNENCVVPCPGPGPNSCIGNALNGPGGTALPHELQREPEWLRSGTGQMGDLTELNPGFPPARE